MLCKASRPTSSAISAHCMKTMLLLFSRDLNQSNVCFEIPHCLSGGVRFRDLEHSMRFDNSSEYI